MSSATGSSAGPSAVHQACVRTTTPAGVPTTVEMSSAVWPGVPMSRTAGVSSRSASASIHWVPR